MTTPKLRTEFPNDKAGNDAYLQHLKEVEELNAKEALANAIVANPPQQVKRKVYVSEISAEIVKNSMVNGQPRENRFHMVTASDPDGTSEQFAINSAFYGRVKSQFIADRYYELTFEVRKEGQTTYMDSQKKVQKHLSSGETLVNFQVITERSFTGVQMSLNAKINTIVGQPEGYSMAIASLLK